MKDWKLAEAQRRLGEVMRRAKLCGPQRVMGTDGDAFVLSARDYKRFVIGFTFDDEDEGDEIEPAPLVEFLQKSPFAEAVRAGDFPWEWDDATRSWVVPR